MQNKSMQIKSMQNKSMNTRTIAMTGMLSAIAYILMFLEFSVPLMPGFIKMDFSELPALIGAFALGPVPGIVICLVKNVIHLMQTATGGVGELANFLIGAVFVFTAGMVYRHKKTKKNAVIGSFAGAVMMALVSVPINYFLVYPVYTNFMPMENIIAAYQVIVPSVDSLLDCLVVFNLPFTFVKAMISVVVTLLVYKRISPILKSRPV